MCDVADSVLNSNMPPMYSHPPSCCSRGCVCRTWRLYDTIHNGVYNWRSGARNLAAIKSFCKSCCYDPGPHFSFSGPLIPFPRHSLLSNPLIHMCYKSCHPKECHVSSWIAMSPPEPHLTPFNPFYCPTLLTADL